MEARRPILKLKHQQSHGYTDAVQTEDIEDHKSINKCPLVFGKETYRAALALSLNGMTEDT